MDGVLVDPDGLRAAAALARHQAEQVTGIEDYLHRTCQAAGAFAGPSILSLFEGTYENAFRIAADGLKASATTNGKVAEMLEACAAAYQAADRASYDGFARIAGGENWGVDPYSAVGSGQSTFTRGGCLPAGTAPGEPGAPAAGGGGVLGALDSASAFTSEYVDEHAKSVLGQMSHETVMHEGKRIYKDDLPYEEDENGKIVRDIYGEPKRVKADQEIPGLLDWTESGLKKRLEFIDDPLGIEDRKGRFVDAMVEKVDLPGRIGAERSITDAFDNERGGVHSMVGREQDKDYYAAAKREHEIGERVDKVTGVYDAGKAVLDNGADITLGTKESLTGLKGTWDELNAAAASRDKMQDIAGAGPNSSATNWGRS